jgi:hypothetical protein
MYLDIDAFLLIYLTQKEEVFNPACEIHNFKVRKSDNLTFLLETTNTKLTLKNNNEKIIRYKTTRFLLVLP